jgi:DNA polymerase sigma
VGGKMKGTNMQKFTEGQIKRQDFVDNQIYDLVKQLTPSKREIEWNIEMIGDIRDTIQHWLVDKYGIVDELEFYP